MAAAIVALLGLLATTSWGVSVAHGAAYNAPQTTADAAAAPHRLKAVFIVGPTNALTQMNLTDAEELAKVAESYGMDVRRVFYPHATWANVLANIQGANLVVYMGHGYGFPSPYQKVLTESRQNGIGLNTYDGSGTSQYTYYGANMLKQYVKLAPNAIVFLNHLCYSAGNGEPGSTRPTYDLARERVDNMANGWLATGAKTVFAYGEQLYVRSLRALFDPAIDYSMEDIFRIPGPKPTEYFGWVGWDARKLPSVRTPGATNFLDPSQSEGFYRAISGTLDMKASQWRAGPSDASAPTLRTLTATTDGAAALVGATGALFTPNGDGATDLVNLGYATDKETFVDWTVTNGAGAVVRRFSSWTVAGAGAASWNGKSDAGSYVPDGKYTITASPSSRAGNAGAAQSVTVSVLTTMASPAASPTQIYAADGDALAPGTNLSVTLKQPAALTWTVVDRNNNVVRTNLTNATTAAGNVSWRWDGKNSAGAYVPDGTYYSLMTAATSAGTYSQRVAVDVTAFRLLPAVAAPFARATKVKFTVFSAEPLAAKPKVRVTMPGLAPKTYGMSNLAGGGFVVTITFPATAGAGTVQFLVTGTDTGAGVQSSSFSYQLN